MKSAWRRLSTIRPLAAYKTHPASFAPLHGLTSTRTPIQPQRLSPTSTFLDTPAGMSAPMIAWVPAVNNIYRYFTSGPSTYSQSVDIPPVAQHEIETSPEKTPRTLKHLLRANHINYSVIYHELHFHNHMSHILGSAFLFGANVDQMQHIYDVESKELEPWHDSPAEITEADWREFLGNKLYQRSYVDFFEDELALKFGYDWKKLVEEYIGRGKRPLVNGLIGGLGHPLIHLAYAYELGSKELAMEALATASVSYDPLFAKYLDSPSYTKSSTYATTSPLEVLDKIASDTRFDGLFKDKGPENISILLEKHEDLVLEHWNAWSIEDPVKQFRDSQEAAVALLVRTVKSGTHSYDFFIVHILTTSHAVRILLPLLPKKLHIGLVREWWLLTIAVYIAQGRPKIDHDLVEKPTKGWSYVEDKALNGQWATDAHYVKALRAIREAAFTWGDEHERYISAAVNFADDFHGWTGWS